MRLTLRPPAAVSPGGRTARAATRTALTILTSLTVLVAVGVVGGWVVGHLLVEVVEALLRLVASGSG